MYIISSRVLSFFFFFLLGCNFVLAHMHHSSKNATEMFDLYMNVASV